MAKTLAFQASNPCSTRGPRIMNASAQMDDDFEEAYSLYVENKQLIKECRAICEDLKDDTIPPSEQSNNARV